MATTKRNLQHPPRKMPLTDGWERTIAKRVIKGYRKKHFLPEDRFLHDRGFASLKKKYGFDMRAFLSRLLHTPLQEARHPREKSGKRNKARPALRILSSGASHLELDRDIKQAFGSRVFLTSLDLITPLTTSYARKKLYAGEVKDIGKEKAMLRRRIRSRTSRRARMVDELAVSCIEGFNAKEKYDVALDITGPLQDGARLALVLSSYYNSLKQGGILLTTPTAIMTPTFTDPNTGKTNSFAEVTQRGSRMRVFVKK